MTAERAAARRTLIRALVLLLARSRGRLIRSDPPEACRPRQWPGERWQESFLWEMGFYERRKSAFRGPTTRSLKRNKEKIVKSVHGMAAAFRKARRSISYKPCKSCCLNCTRSRRRRAFAQVFELAKKVRSRGQVSLILYKVSWHEAKGASYWQSLEKQWAYRGWEEAEREKREGEPTVQ